jgi:hypothetical protein
MDTDLLKVGKLYEMKNSRRVKKEVPVFASLNDVKYFQEKTIVMVVEKKVYMGFNPENYVKILLDDKTYIIHSVYLEELQE